MTTCGRRRNHQKNNKVPKLRAMFISSSLSITVAYLKGLSMKAWINNLWKEKEESD